MQTQDEKTMKMHWLWKIAGISWPKNLNDDNSVLQCVNNSAGKCRSVDTLDNGLVTKKEYQLTDTHNALQARLE